MFAAAAVASIRKRFVFVLERETGKPVFPIEEKPFPASDLPGERAWPTQPIPSLPPPLVPQTLTEADLYAPTPEHFAACKAKLATLRNDGLFTPPSETGSILYPFTGGGANWSSATWDPQRQLLVVPVQNLAHVVRLDRVAPHEAGDVKPLHGFSVGTLWWLLTGRGTGERFRLHPSTGRTIFKIDDIPCNAPPWGRLVAVDLANGGIAWSVSTARARMTSSVFPATAPRSRPPAVWFSTQARTLLRYACTTRIQVDSSRHSRCRPVSTRALSRTSFGPDGKQFVVVAPGGHVGIGSKLGGYVIAYTLPDTAPAAPQPER